MIKKTKNQITGVDRRGFMLIEALTVLFIFSLITVTFYSVFTVGIRYIQDAKNRLGALAIASEKIEIIRNLTYDSIATDGGAIEGDIPQDEDIYENTRQYHVHTEVAYVDDPFDGTGFSDVIWFEDYKKVTLTVSWSNGENTEKVELISRFVPPGNEIKRIGDGILSVNVFSDQPGGAGIPDSKVAIYNPASGIDTYSYTDASGSVTFMGSGLSNFIQQYQLTVTKAGHETVVTMPPYPESSYEPVDVHASVVTGSMNVKNIVQNELANIRILTVNPLDEPIANVDFYLVGGRKLGTDMTVLPSVSIYNLNQNSETESDGEKEFNLVSPGGYNFSLIDSALDDYEIISINPGASFFLLSAVGTLEVKVRLAKKTTPALLMTVLDDFDDLPIQGARVRLINTTLGYDKEIETASDGKVFFPDSAVPFLPGTYQLEIRADGFSDSDSSVIINPDELKLETKKITAS